MLRRTAFATVESDRRSSRALLLLVSLCVLLLHGGRLAEAKARRLRRQHSGAAPSTEHSGAPAPSRTVASLPEIGVVADLTPPDGVPDLPPGYAIDQHYEMGPDGQSVHVTAATAYISKALADGRSDTAAFALAAFAAACRDSPSNFRSWMNLGTARDRLGRRVDALDAFRYGASVMTPGERRNPSTVLHVGETLANSVAATVAAIHASTTQSEPDSTGRWSSLRSELEKHKLNVLLRRSRSEGLAEELLDEAMESDAPKQELIRLMVNQRIEASAVTSIAPALDRDYSAHLANLKMLVTAIEMAEDVFSGRGVAPGARGSPQMSMLMAGLDGMATTIGSSSDVGVTASGETSTPYTQLLQWASEAAPDVLCSLALYGPTGTEPLHCLRALLSIGQTSPAMQSFMRRLTARVESAAVARVSSDPSARKTTQLRRYANLAESLATVKAELLSEDSTDLGAHWRSDLTPADAETDNLSRPPEGTLTRDEREAEASRISLAYDYLEVIYVRDKELHDRTGRFNEYLAAIGSIGVRALKDHGWRLKHDGWREYLTGGDDLGPAGKRTGYLDLIINAHRHARNYTGMGRWLQRRGEMLYGDGIGLTPEGIDFSDNNFAVSCNKVNHDLMQVSYLEEQGLISADRATDATRRLSEFLAIIEPMIGCDEKVYRNFPKMRQMSSATKMHNQHALTEAEYSIVRPVYNRHLYISEQLDWNTRSALNMDLDWRAIEENYMRDNVTYIDEFLTNEALDETQRYCLETMAWFDTRSGYVGAYRDGFQPPALLRAAEQLHEVLPRILDKHTLKYHWAHVFDPQQNPVGIDAHVDEAAVNFNFWSTDNDASLDTERNGLQVFQTVPSLSKSFKDYNDFKTKAEVDAVSAELEKAPSTRIPYRRNRMVFFHSDLWHRTDGTAFKAGFKNKRINLTLLFGERQKWGDQEEGLLPELRDLSSAEHAAGD